MDEHILHVTGMTCEHCVRAVTDELTSVSGVDTVHVELVPGGISQVAVQTAPTVTQEQLAAAIVEAGYDIAL